MAVTETDIRNLLDNISSKFVVAATITANITRATVFVNAVKRNDASSSDVDQAVASFAAYTTYLSYSEGMSRQLSPQDLTAIKTKLDHMKNLAEILINIVAASPVDLDNTGSSDPENMEPVHPNNATLVGSDGFVSN